MIPIQPNRSVSPSISGLEALVLTCVTGRASSFALVRFHLDHLFFAHARVPPSRRNMARFCSPLFAKR
eukprot:3366599-Pleurochrysis_carterae.AAC.1